MTAPDPNLAPVPGFGTPADPLREYAKLGSLWEGQPRPFHNPSVQLLVQHAGILHQLAAVRTIDPVFRMADVQRYMESHKIDHPAIPELLPNLTPAEAGGYVDILLAHGLQLIRLKTLLKEPVEAGWNTGIELTRDEAVAHLAAGGNIGWDVGKSRKVVIDCEDSRATAAMIAAGFHPDVATANGVDPTSPKFGGRHFIFDVPEGISDAQLRSRLGVELGGASATSSRPRTRSRARCGKSWAAPMRSSSGGTAATPWRLAASCSVPAPAGTGCTRSSPPGRQTVPHRCGCGASVTNLLQSPSRNSRECWCRSRSASTSRTRSATASPRRWTRSTGTSGSPTATASCSSSATTAAADAASTPT